MEGSIPRLLRKIVPSRNVVEIQLRPVNDDEPETQRRISLIPLMITGLNARTMALQSWKMGYTLTIGMWRFFFSFLPLILRSLCVCLLGFFFFFFFIKIGDFGGVQLNVDWKSTSAWKLKLFRSEQGFYIGFSILDNKIIY